MTQERKQMVKTDSQEVNDAQFDCTVCDFVSPLKYSFQRHMNKIHKKTEIEIRKMLQKEGSESESNDNLCTVNISAARKI